MPNFKIEILDGEILRLDQILKKMDGDIVGISPKVFSYETCLEISKYAKEGGAKVILGGNFVSGSGVAKLILKKNQQIDGIVIGDGESAILEFSLGTKLDKVPNLVYREKNSIRINEFIAEDINDMPSIDYDIVDLSIYRNNYYKKFPKHMFNNPLLYYSQKGCHWYDKSGGCLFCRNQSSKNLRKSPLE